MQGYNPNPEKRSSNHLNFWVTWRTTLKCASNFGPDRPPGFDWGDRWPEDPVAYHYYPHRSTPPHLPPNHITADPLHTPIIAPIHPTTRLHRLHHCHSSWNCGAIVTSLLYIHSIRNHRIHPIRIEITSRGPVVRVIPLAGTPPFPRLVSQWCPPPHHVKPSSELQYIDYTINQKG